MVEFRPRKEQINVELLMEYFKEPYINNANCPLAQGVKKIMPMSDTISVTPDFVWAENKRFNIVEAWINGEIPTGVCDVVALLDKDGNVEYVLDEISKKQKYEPNTFGATHFFKCRELIHTGKFKSCMVVIEEA